MQALIETSELAKLLNQPNVKILDATYHVPPSPRNAKEEFLAQHIPGAQFFDIDGISDPNSPYPHMLPSLVDFEKTVSALGISNRDHVIVYDVHGIMSAPRAWWMFRYFGHDNVSVLNGGLPKWLSENLPVTNDKTVPKPGQFKASSRPDLVLAVDQVVDNLAKKEYQILDCRPQARYLGEVDEPRAGLRKGHIPASLSLPWASVVDADSKTLLEPETLRAVLAKAKINLDQAFGCTCGSGVTACVGALALYTLGHQNVPVYDGSWAEWGSRDDLPVESMVHS